MVVLMAGATAAAMLRARVRVLGWKIGGIYRWFLPFGFIFWRSGRVGPVLWVTSPNQTPRVRFFLLQVGHAFIQCF